MIGKPASQEAYQLLHNGAIALSQIEATGIRIDTKVLEGNIKQTERDIFLLEDEIKKDPLWRTWRKRYGEKTNLGSRSQLAHILFEVEGYEYLTREETQEGEKKISGAKYKASESVLQAIDLDFVRNYIKWQKLSKAKGTFLEGIQKEVCDGLLHAIYNLNTVITFRSSSDSPNFQNLPIRDKELGKLIRSCFVPRKNHIFLEIDFKGIEVRVAACYHKDPVMIDYILDETKDMHRDMAAQCYMIEPDQVSKESRYAGKNMFVFPEFYGDYYIDCARNMWEAILKMSLTTKGGVPIGEVLAKHGIRELGRCDPRQKPRANTFESHIKQVEDDFWKRRFKVYGKWKERWYQKYREAGWFQMLTGFVISGLLKKNDVINYPVQGAAFHCLLWSLIRLQRWMTKHNLKSKIVGQIHDSLLIDTHRSEIKIVYQKATQIMTELIMQHYQWLIVPLEIEVEAAEKNWHEKQPFSIAV